MRWITRAGAGSLAAAAVAAFGYGLTLAPTVGAGDSGELILAAQSLGIPHPPGYPVWVLLARIASLGSWGSPALRVNALSAILAALAAGLFYLLAARCGLRRAARSAATLAFAGSTIVWQSAVQAEVYSLATVFFLALSMAALEARSRRAAPGRADALFFFLAGLSLLVHQTMLFPALVLGIWVLARGFRPSRLLAALAFGAAGFSIVLFLPFRSAAHPALDWGQDRSLTSLWENLLRQNYGGLRQNGFLPARALGETAAIGGAVAGSCGIAASTFALFGAAFSRRHRVALVPLTLAALSIPAALIVLVAFTPDAEHLAQIGPFLTPVLAAAALWAGAGLSAGLRRIPKPARTASAAVCAIALLVTAGLHFRVCDRGLFRLPERYGRDLLEPLPGGATLILDGDNETFLAAYVSRVEGVRPDVTLVNRRGHVFGDPYGLRGIPRSRWPEIQNRVDLARLRSARAPVYYTTPPTDLARSGVRFAAEGIVYRATLPADAGPGAKPSGDGPNPALDARWPKSSDLLPGGPGRYDYMTRKLAVTYSDARAQALWREGRFEEAYPWFEDAARVGFDFPPAHLNLAVAAAASGRPEVTLTELLQAKRLAPYDPEPSARLAVFFAAVGRYRDAAEYFERAYHISPSSELAADAARAWSLAGDRERARYWEARG